jgi:retron-type reverse transcriptase
MTQNLLWATLLTNSALKAGWHLARNDLRDDLVEDRFFPDAVASNLDSHVAEILRQLKTDTYRFHPIVAIDVPKSGLAVRPGTVIHLSDRIVLFAAVKLLAPILDKLLPDCVYSYRYKSDGNKKSLFHETDILDIPFLKKKTIQKYIEPFDPWYALWPLFDEESKKALLEGYDHLVVSDISAYFENINLEILRSQLYDKVPGEQKITNLLVDSLESWAVQTENGFRPRRGIPQGSAISSFVGNIFLLPLDECFEEMKKNHDIRYYRYMDDVRIFCKDTAVARKMIFKLEATIRKLHLNLQGAKTKILREPDQITKYLIDKRITYLKDMRDDVQKNGKSYDKVQWMALRTGLWNMAKSQGIWTSYPKIAGATKPLNDLSLRAFRIWIGLLRSIGDSDYIRYLFREMCLNPDHRLTRAFISTLRTFPRKTAFVGKVLSFLKSPLNIFPHQTAELMQSLRYPSRLSNSVREYVMARLLDPTEHYYVRSQACMLTGRFRLEPKELQAIVKLSMSEIDTLVLSAFFIPLAQLPVLRVRENISRLSNHANERVRILASYVAQLMTDPKVAKGFLDFVFKDKNDMRICDYIGYFWYVASSSNAEILNAFMDKSALACAKHPTMDIRDCLQFIRERCGKEIEKLKA